MNEELHELKRRDLESRTQYILFEPSGNVVGSCDTLMSMIPGRTNVFDLFPMLRAMQPTMGNMHPEDRELLYPVVELPLDGRDAILDFRIRCMHRDGARTWLLTMHDNTEVYSCILRLKQRYTDRRLKTELKAIR